MKTKVKKVEKKQIVLTLSIEEAEHLIILANALAWESINEDGFRKFVSDLYDAHQ